MPSPKCPERCWTPPPLSTSRPTISIIYIPNNISSLPQSRRAHPLLAVPTPFAILVDIIIAMGIKRPLPPLVTPSSAASRRRLFSKQPRLPTLIPLPQSEMRPREAPRKVMPPRGRGFTERGRRPANTARSRESPPRKEMTTGELAQEKERRNWAQRRRQRRL